MGASSNKTLSNSQACSLITGISIMMSCAWEDGVPGGSQMGDIIVKRLTHLNSANQRGPLHPPISALAGRMVYHEGYR